MAIEQPQNQEDEKDQSSTQGVATGGGATQSSGGGNASAAPGAGPARAPQGSGRFVNLSKYLSANQGAGERLGQGIQAQVQRGFGQTEKEIGKNKGETESALQSGEQTLGRGQQFGQKLQDYSQAEQITQDPNQLQDFTKFRFGQGVDEQSIFDRNRAYQQSVIGGQQQAQNRLGQVGTEEGRYGLLKETFGGRGTAQPQYSTGQQRLDQLFLQAGAGDQIRQLQGGIQQNLQGLGQQAKQAETFGTQAQDLASREQALAGVLTQGAQGLQDRFTQELQGQIDPFNQQRLAQQAGFRDQYDILTGKKQGQLSDDFLQQMGLKRGQRVYNVLGDSNLTPEQIAQFSGQQATGIADVADQQEVARMNALRRLSMGTLGAEGQYQYDPTQDLAANHLEGAISPTGELGNRIKTAQQQYDTYTSGFAPRLQDAINSASAVSGGGTSARNLFNEAMGGAQNNVSGYANAIKAVQSGGVNDQTMANLIAQYDQMVAQGFQPGSKYLAGIEPLIQEYKAMNPTAVIPHNFASGVAAGQQFTIPGRTPGSSGGTLIGGGPKIGI